ncbi:MAG: NAD-dependent epimerase/dehydratase family protein [Planctomyces sp.]
MSGASGLVGGRLVQLLKAAGHTVLPISRRSTDSSTGQAAPRSSHRKDSAEYVG